MVFCYRLARTGRQADEMITPDIPDRSVGEALHDPPECEGQHREDAEQERTLDGTDRGDR